VSLIPEVYYTALSYGNKAIYFEPSNSFKIPRWVIVAFCLNL